LACVLLVGVFVATVIFAIRSWFPNYSIVVRGAAALLSFLSLQVQLKVRAMLSPTG
jgi:hypothetical protein